MFIERIEIPKPPEDRSPRPKVKVVMRYACDHCGIVFERNPSKGSKSRSGFTFCSNPCKFASHSDGKLKEHALATCKERYGDERPMRTDAVKQRRKRTLLANHGVEHTMHDPALKEKRRQTHLERYGVAETFQSPKLRSKREATWSKRYGVPYVPFPENALELSRAAMERMPQKWSSQVEEDLCTMLMERFGPIQRQKHVNGWPIDAYVPSLDTYVQLDGVYWHGLDQPIEQIRASSVPRDQARAQKWETDRKQDAWFAEQGLRLVRITDVDVHTNGLHALDRLDLRAPARLPVGHHETRPAAC